MPFWNGSREERLLIAIKTRRTYSECVRVKSLRSYEQAGEVSRMELQKGHEDFVEKSQAGILPAAFQGLPL